MKNILETSYASWSLAFLAIVAWGGVGFFAWSVSNAEATRVFAENSLGDKTSEVDSVLRLHALARETKELRAALDTLSQTDVVSIVEAIEAIGREARVSLSITQVLAGDPLPTPASEISPTRPVTVVIDAGGSFETLLHAAALLHTLPVPSSVEQMQFAHLPLGADIKKGTWRLSLRLQVLTTAPISS